MNSFLHLTIFQSMSTLFQPLYLKTERENRLVVRCISKLIQELEIKIHSSLNLFSAFGILLQGQYTETVEGQSLPWDNFPREKC